MNYNEQISAFNPSGLRRHMVKTYSWMMLGVLITFVIAAFASITGLTMNLYANYSFYPIAMMVIQVGVVIALTNRLMKGSYSTTVILFLVYSALTGLTISVYAYIYTGDTILIAFLAAAVYFVSLVVIGYTTKIDLSKIGSVSMIGLFAMIGYSFVAFLFGMDTNSIMFSAIGLVVFTGLTAWDSQKAKKLYIQYEGDTQMVKKLGIYSALELYLDFINIFIYILRIIGNRD